MLSTINLYPESWTSRQQTSPPSTATSWPRPSPRWSSATSLTPPCAPTTSTPSSPPPSSRPPTCTLSTSGGTLTAFPRPPALAVTSVPPRAASTPCWRRPLGVFVGSTTTPRGWRWWRAATARVGTPGGRVRPCMAPRRRRKILTLTNDASNKLINILHYCVFHF